ncbi:uncharacterized protein [Watersipora subatra]|uniref:uncharacterized protein n=1 Tax=Watersipora subatra TaxID=2589382 RepID=UPI00355B5F04
MYNGVRHVIHAIAPVPVKGRDVSPLLVKTISSALSEVEKLKCGTVAFPAICAEDRSVPISTCADCYSTAMKEFFSTNPATCLQQIYFVVDDASFVDNLYRAIANMSLDRRTDVPDPDQQLKDIKSIDSAVYSGTASRVTNNPPIVTSDQCPSRTSPVDKSYVDNGHNSITGETSRARSFSDPCCALPLIDQEPLHRHFSTNAIHNTDTTAGDKSSVGGVTRCARLTTTTVVATSVVTEVKRKKYDCPICLDDLKDPESLPCSHKFCKDCIKQLIETSETRQCPTCRQPFGNERSLMEDD